MEFIKYDIVFGKVSPMNHLFAALLLLLSALCLFSASHHLAGYWLTGRKARGRLVFSVMAFFAFANVIPTLFLMRAVTEQQARLALWWDLALFLPLLMALIWFADLHCGVSNPKPKLAFFAVGMSLWVFHLLIPGGLVFGSFHGFVSYTLPWGEVVHFSKLSASPWAFLYYLYLLAALSYLTYRGVRLFQGPRRRSGAIFLTCVGVGWLLALHDLFLDYGLISGFYIGVLVVPVFVVMYGLEFDLERNRQERFYTILFDSLSEAVLLYDAETLKLLNFNATASQMFGYEPGELEGMDCRLLAPVGAVNVEEEMRERYQRSLRSGVSVFEWRARRKDGRSIWIEASLRPVRLSGKDCMTVVLRDIGQRKRDQAELVQSENKFRNLVELSPIGFHFFHLDGEGRLIFDGANRAADRILRQDHGSLTGLPFEVAFPNLKDTELPYRYRLAARDGVRWHSETVDYQDDRMLGAYDVFVMQTQADHAAAMFYDTSQRMRMEDERRRIQSRLQDTQRLESLGVLAGGIAHDFNNMLMAIRGSADELEGCPGYKAHDECGRSVEVIRKVADRAAELCRQLLAYAGRGVIVPQPMDLRRAVEETGRMIEVAVSKKVRLDYRWSDPLPLVKADASQIRQVVLSLLTNAAESFGQEAGRILVNIQPRVLEIPDLGLPAGGYLALEITDNGAGMDPETQEHIFEPFFTTKLSGRGLGLASVQGILRSHGGAIQVKSAPGQGTTMTVLLPVAKEKTAPVAESTPPVAPTRLVGHALLVDDEPDVRHVTKRMLEKLGLTVDEAGNGLEGVSRVRLGPERYAVAVVDLAMPDLDGIEALGRMLVLRPNLPAVLITGYGADTTRARLKDLPSVVMVQKPFGKEELAAAILKAGVPQGGAMDAKSNKASREDIKLALVRLNGQCRDIGDYYAELGRLFLTFPGIRFAWVGLLGPDGVSVVPVVESGDGGSYLHDNQFRADDSVYGRGPAGMAIKTGETRFANDVASEPHFDPWREKALRAGFVSMAGIPITIQGKSVGVLCLYSATKDFFDGDNRSFFQEVSLLLAEGFRRFRQEDRV